MARDIWAETEEVETSGDFEASNGSGCIPDGTKVRATIEKAEWHSFAGSTHENPNIKWVVEEGDEYAGRVFFQKVKLNGDDPSGNFYKPEKQDKIMENAAGIFRAIDKNAGGFIFGLKRKPTSDELQKYLVGATMLVTLGEYNKAQFVRGVSTDTEAPVKAVAKPKVAALAEDDIPF